MVIFLTRSEYASSFIFYHYYNETIYFRRCQMFFSFRLRHSIHGRWRSREVWSRRAGQPRLETEIIIMIRAKILTTKMTLKKENGLAI